MADPVAVKQALARLASDADADRAVISQADAAIDDLDAAVTFVRDVGVARLAVAVERQRAAGNTGAAARGEQALEAFRRYRRAAGTTTRPGAPVVHQPDAEPVEFRDGAGSHGASASNGCHRSNGDSGNELAVERIESSLETIGVGIEPVDGDASVDQFRQADPESGGGSGDPEARSGWRTLDGEQFHSHSGYGNGLGTGSEEGRR